MLTPYELADAVLSGRTVTASIPADAPASEGAVESKICEAWHVTNRKCQRQFFRRVEGNISQRPRYCPQCR